jgi:hypothetical protein
MNGPKAAEQSAVFFEERGDVESGCVAPLEQLKTFHAPVR